MHGYIIILPLPHLTSEQRAYNISRELYNITVPLAIQEEYHKDGTVFGVVKHQDGFQCALHVAYADGVAASSVSTTPPTGIDVNDIGQFQRVSTAFYACNNMQELVIWDSDQSTDRTGIETNINDYYSIY